MRVAGDGEDIAGEVGWVVGEAFTDVTWLTPRVEDLVKAIGENGGREVD